MTTQNVTRRRFLKISTAAGFGALLAACGTTAPTAPAAGGGAAAPAAAGMDALVEAAKKEAELTVIALPNDWSNYGEMKEKFKAKYSFLKLNDLNPDAGSADEVEAIKANKDNKGPQAPDVIDVGFAFGESSKKES